VSPSQKPKPQTVICPVCGLELPANLKKCPQDGVALTGNHSPADPLVGTVVGGRYEILSLVGRGGMSVVYKARNRAVGSIVAVKTLKVDLVSDEELFARFCQEAKAVQTLIHPNIVTVHEFGVTLSGQPFIVMDYLDGATLSDILEKTERLSVRRVLKIFIQVCDAIAHAHAHKIIHRDIKPGNIMLVETANETDFVKMFDFGFAKILPKSGLAVQALTQQGDVLGTPLYMSPEQSRGKQLDTRTDIYSLGCVMYEALTGKAPIIGDNVLDTMQKQINERPATLEKARPDLYIPEALTTVLFKTLEKDPSARYQMMTDLKRDLEVIDSALQGRHNITQSSLSLPDLAKLKRLPEGRDTVFSTAAHLATVCLIVICTTIVVLWYLNRNHIQTPALSSDTSMATLRGDPEVNLAKYRQAALVAMKAKNFSEAESLIGQALKEAEKCSPNKLPLADTLSDYAQMLRRTGRLTEADKAEERARAIRSSIEN
jgi:serine/threonine protein kinase